MSWGGGGGGGGGRENNRYVLGVDLILMMS